jgi:GrpB-like predicted nucleotidyltransferase (UPF0157 family)
MSSESESWPAWATEKVEVVDPDPNWHKRGIDEIAQLKRLLAGLEIDHFEHIGSTAVPGLPAKPILDLMAQIPSFDRVDSIIEVLQPKQWHFVSPELDARPWRRFFVKVDDSASHRIAHFHLMLPEEPRWKQQLQFRDALRQDPLLAQAYGKLKREIADKYSDDREAYTVAKAEFIREALLDN